MDTITITCASIGSVKKIKLNQGANLRNLLDLYPGYRNSESIRLRGSDDEVNIGYQFSNDDVLLFLSSISGEAPVIDDVNYGLELIQTFLRKAKNLIVVDPYILSGQGDGKESVDMLTEVIDWNSLKSIHFILDNRKINEKVHDGINSICKNRGATISTTHTTKIHDRVWIKDNSSALNVGTSLSGVGKRVALAHTLSDSDFTVFVNILEKYGVL